MKTNIKALQLVEKGLSSKTISNLTESQIDILHKKMIGEQPVNNTKIANAIKGLDLLKLKADEVGAKMKNIGLEEEDIDEDANLDNSAEKEGGYDPYAGNSVGNDNGPGEYGNNPAKDKQMDDGFGIFEEEKNRSNAWSICHSQVGPKKSRKWERCVKEVKKQLKEGKNPVSLFLETQIQKIVEKHMPPKITKGDLIKYISEASPAPAPTTKPSPTTKPGTKPGKRPNPFKNPNPGENPAPKAKKVSPEDAKEKVIDVIMQLLEK